MTEGKKKTNKIGMVLLGMLAGIIAIGGAISVYGKLTGKNNASLLEEIAALETAGFSEESMPAFKADSEVEWETEPSMEPAVESKVGITAEETVDRGSLSDVKKGNSMEQQTKDTSEMILPDSSIRILSDADVYGLSQENLRIAINEIYARHGRMFKDKELQGWFDGKAWYNGTIPAESFDERCLSQIEKDNIKLLQQKRDGTTSSTAPKALSGKYEMQFEDKGGAELEIVYGSGDDLFTAEFSGSWLDYAGYTAGYLVAKTDGANGTWYYYTDDMDGIAMQIQYNGADTITVTSLADQNFGGMGFPGFEGTYRRTAEYPMP